MDGFSLNKQLKMSKGSKPRPTKKDQFDKNYESINWKRKSKERELVDDCPVLYRWGKDD